MNKNEENVYLVKKAIEIVDLEIKKKENPCNIRKIVAAKLGFSEKQFDRIFRTVMEVSLAEYIKLTMYEKSFEMWKEDEKKLKQRETYNGIANFSYNFKRRFGFSLTEAKAKGIRLQKPNKREENEQEKVEKK